MDIDFELYRRDIIVSDEPPVRISVIDIAPEHPQHTIVMIHGFGGYARQWKHQLRSLSLTSRCIALDLRGHGKSDKPPTDYTVDELIADVEAVITRLVGDSAVVLMGHSFGGALATTFAHRYPLRVERLILTATASKFELASYTKALLGLPLWVLNLVRPFVRKQISAPPIVLKRFARNALYRWNGRGMMRSLSMPVLVIRGARDVVFPEASYEEVARLIPRAEEVNVGVSQHMVILERQDAVHRAIERFLDMGHASWRSGARDEEIRAALISERPWLKVYDAGVPLTIGIPSAPLHTLLTSAVRRFPNNTALVFMNNRMPYWYVDRQVNRLANALIRLGAGKGTRVMLLMPNTPQWVIAFFAVLRAGAVVVGSSPVSSADEITREMNESGAQVIITLRRFAPLVRDVRQRAPSLRSVIYTAVTDYLSFPQQGFAKLLGKDTGSAKPLGELHPGEYLWTRLLVTSSPSSPEIFQESSDPAVIQYTGGTTASPKGVVLSHRALIANAFQTRHWMPGINEGRERVLCVVPFAHVYGMTAAMNTGIAMGASLIILPNFALSDVLRTVKRQKPTLFPGVPTMYVAINNAPGVRKYGFTNIRACLSGAAPLPVEVQEQFERLTRGRLVEGYGLTEAAPVTHANPLFGARKTGTIGVPLPNTEAKVVHLVTGETLLPGEVGELVVRGPQLMDGYLGHDDLTAAALRDGWLFTGDVARMDADGYFQIISRKRDMWVQDKMGEEALLAFPRDVEEVIYEIPEVKEAAVVGVGNKPVAFVTVNREISAGTIQGYCARRLPESLVPVLIVFVDEMPRSFVGKIVRRQLLDRLPERQRAELDITSDRIDEMLDYPGSTPE